MNVMLPFTVAPPVASLSTPAISPSATALAASAVSVTSAPPLPIPSVAFSPSMTGSLPPPDNYIFWRAQVLPLLRNHYLLGYVDGSLPFPPALVDSVHGPAVNPAYRVWTGQNQANLLAIQGSLIPEVSGMTVFAKTSYEAWTSLESSFSAQSLAHSSAFRHQLGECEKHNMSDTTYYNKVRALAGTLASIGQPISDTEFFSNLLNSLDEEYDGFIAVVNERDTPMSPHALYSQPLVIEQRLEEHRCTGGHADLAAHAAPMGGSQALYVARALGSGKAPPSYSGGGRSPCVYQLCERERHIASKCH
jgi:hypothetical protein